jgi:hypothetical protein
MNHYKRGQRSLSALLTEAGSQEWMDRRMQGLYAVAVAQSMLLMEDFQEVSSCMDAFAVPTWIEREVIEYLIGTCKSIADISDSHNGGANKPSCK